MAALPRARLHEMDRPFLMMECYQHQFETFKCAWLDYALRLRTQDVDLLRDQLLRCVERDMRKALMAKLGADRMAQTSSTQ